MSVQATTVVFPPFFNLASFASATLALSAAATYYGAAIIPLNGGTLSKVRAYVSSVTGSPIAADAVCELRADNNGVPSGSVTESKTASSAPAASTVLEFTGFTTVLSANTLYWLVIRNANGTPASNNFTLRRWADPINVNWAIASPGYGAYFDASSTDSGTNWTLANNTPAVVIEYSGGAREGFLITGFASAAQIYTNREAGSVFTTPSNITLNVAGVLMIASKSGTPTGNLRYRIYSGTAASPTLVATTQTVTPAQVNTTSTDAYRPLYFSSIQSIAGGTQLRVVASETTNSDASSNRYNVQNGVTLNSGDANIIPFLGTPASTLSTDGGATFTDTTNTYTPVYLILDNENPYTAATGGASAYTFIG